MAATTQKLFRLILLGAAFFGACSPTSSHHKTSPGRSVNTVSIHNIPRSYILRLPPKYDGKTKLPLVMLIHGATDSAAYAERAYHFVEKAAADNFVLVLPDSNSEDHVWNGFDPDTTAAPNNDLAFLTTLLKTLPQKYAIDASRIYVCGHSSGAMMTYRLIAEHPDLIAAAGIVAGEVDPDVIVPKAPVPLIIFHGKIDPTVPYENLADAVALWTRADHCRPTPTRTDRPVPTVMHSVYLPTDKTGAEISVYTILNGNHMWPGGVAMPGKTQIPVQDISATDLMWHFFQTHRR